jgi:hypothetical protein
MTANRQCPLAVFLARRYNATREERGRFWWFGEVFSPAAPKETTTRKTKGQAMRQRTLDFFKGKLTEAMVAFGDVMNEEHPDDWSEVGWCGKNLPSLMADAALAVLRANSEGSDAAEDNAAAN